MVQYLDPEISIDVIRSSNSAGGFLSIAVAEATCGIQSLDVWILDDHDDLGLAVDVSRMDVARDVSLAFFLS